MNNPMNLSFPRAKQKVGYITHQCIICGDIAPHMCRGCEQHVCTFHLSSHVSIYCKAIVDKIIESHKE